MIRLLAHALAALERWVLGLSVDEIRYTFEDVRAELRATRAELKAEIAELRRDLDRVARPGDRPVRAGEEEEPGLRARSAAAGPGPQL